MSEGFEFVFDNDGTLRKSGGAGDSAWSNVCFLEQSGTIEEDSGTLTFSDTCP